MIWVAHLHNMLTQIPYKKSKSAPSKLTKTLQKMDKSVTTERTR
jgi:hypothetical protein